jgi:tetratricopeptide (TPR) repeat protein
VAPAPVPAEPAPAPAAAIAPLPVPVVAEKAPPAPPPEAPKEAESPRFADANAATFVEKGDELFLAKRYPDAVSAYREAIRVEASHSDARYRLGVALAATGDLAAAIEAWEGVLLFDVSHEKARRNIELSRRRLERTGKVEAPDPELALGRARALLGQARYASAESVLTAFLADPSQAKNLDALSLRAEAFVGTGDARSATRDWLVALGLDPRRARFYRGLGDAYRLLGDKPRARYYYEQYLFMAAGQDGEAPYIPVAKQHLGSVR